MQFYVFVVEVAFEKSQESEQSERSFALLCFVVVRLFPSIIVMTLLSILLLFLIASPTWGYYSRRIPTMHIARSTKSSINRAAGSVLDESRGKLDDIVAPDFYWKYRLERFVNKMEDNLPFDVKNYPRASGYQELYQHYLADLHFQKKLINFDWAADQDITDDENLVILDYYDDWLTEVSKKARITEADLPANDLDLLKMFYPSLDISEFEVPFEKELIGADFPYLNLKEMFAAVDNDTFALPPSFSSSTAEDDEEDGDYDYATDIKGEYGEEEGLDLSAGVDVSAQVAALEVETMARLDAALANVTSYARQPYPDEEARAHYLRMRDRLVGRPQTAAEWSASRAKDERDVEEMVAFSSRPVASAREGGGGGDHHDHENEPAAAEAAAEAAAAAREALSQEFEDRFGWRPEQAQQDFALFKANPAKFTEEMIRAKHGSGAADAWRETKGRFSERINAMSEEDKRAATERYMTLLKNAGA